MLCAFDDFLLYRDGRLYRHRRDFFQQGCGHDCINPGAGNPRAKRFAIFELVPGAEVDRGALTDGSMLVGCGQILATFAAQADALQQTLSFTRATGRVAYRISAKPRLVGFKLIPANVSRVCILDQRMPLVSISLAIGNAPARASAQFGSAIGIGAGIAGIMQDAQRQATRQGTPDQLAFVGALDGAHRKLDAGAIEVSDDAVRAGDFAEHLKKQLDRLLNLTIRIKYNLPCFGINQADRQPGAIFGARRFA